MDTVIARDYRGAVIEIPVMDPPCEESVICGSCMGSGDGGPAFPGGDPQEEPVDERATCDNCEGAGWNCNHDHHLQLPEYEESQ